MAFSSRVYLVVKRVGLRSVYELQFTVKSEEFVLDRTSRKGVLAIDARVACDGQG